MAVETRCIPLLRDRHNHPMLYAAFEEGVDLNALDQRKDANDLRAEAIDLIRRHAQRTQAGWTIAHGWNTGLYPLPAEGFDDLARPVAVFNLSLHGLIVNRAGRALLAANDADVAAHLDDTEWVERHLRQVLNVFAAEGATPDRLRRFLDKLLRRHGIYFAEELLLVGETEIRLFDAAGLAGRTRFWAAPDLYERLPPATRERAQGIKLFADGALGAWTAALHRPYKDKGGDDRGMLLYEPRDLAGLLQRYLDSGKPVAVHAIGDAAVDEVVAAVESVGPPPGNEVRIEHAQLISEPTARRAKGLGIKLCMQPNFSDDSRCYAARLPAGYAERNNPFRMLIDRVGYVPGEDLLFGSDGMPHGVHEGLRQSLFPPHPGQVLTIDEFVAGYCLPGCDAGHIEVQIDHDAGQVACRVVMP